MNWVAVHGRMRFERGDLVYEPNEVQTPEYTGPSMGLFMTDTVFSGGEISANVTFAETGPLTVADLVLQYDPATGQMIVAGLGRGASAYSIGGNVGGQGWQNYASTGDRSILTSGKRYQLKATLIGSRATLHIDGVEVLSTILPRPPAPSQVGVIAYNPAEIRFAAFNVKTSAPKAFVVMQFGSPFDELYGEVISAACKEAGLDVIRADEMYGPGLIIADITREIVQAKLVVAEITPSNPNVFFELGFAHAYSKPTILLSRKGTTLPFDVAPFRVLFYEDSIAGKRKVEEGLRRHIASIMNA
jgi:hypothetical protein